ncbi:serine/threonine-protein kinase Stk1 [Halopseudomonas litoralis]|uniref:Serine/threonine-protein kinase Stk1 n=1 Tax=Halopseudomonas litoralis TaxID=797277 RepID=A0A1H1NJV1_9GAMM|nr:serine/threonine-protein kinase [Halopseudomonas litoralis]SDR99197.1 serine/threonine-protein kinase Stk1 [Halopseudomonas litoralis]
MTTTEKEPQSSKLTRLADIVDESPAIQKSQAGSANVLPQILCQRYRIERLLGVGGMGAVYRAKDLLRAHFGDPEPWVALKALNESFVEYPDANALLYSEYALTNRLHHAHIVRLHDFGIDQPSQRAFITMELLKGPTLDQLIEAHPSGLPWIELQNIAIPLLQALVCSHKHGVLHGDLKPSNVILTDDGVRLFDFGLGQAMDGLLPGLPRLSRKRIAAWTPRYAALELINGEPLTASADVYAMACILYELSGGLHPFSRLTAQQAKDMQQDQSLQRPANLPAQCWPALRNALAFDKQQRTMDAVGLLEVFSAPKANWLADVLRNSWPVRPRSGN